MKKINLLVMAIVVMVCNVLVPVYLASAYEPPTSNYKEFEGGTWECKGYVYIPVRGRGRQTVVDITLTIEKIADGKVVGKYITKEKEDKEPSIISFASNIENTPDGLLRIGFKGTTGYYLGYDMQKDGTFKSSTGPVLTRVSK